MTINIITAEPHLPSLQVSGCSFTQTGTLMIVLLEHFAETVRFIRVFKYINVQASITQNVNTPWTK